MKHLCILITLLALPFLHAAEPPKPRSGEKLIVINDDGFSAFYSGRYKTAEDLRKQVMSFKDTQVGVFEWCVIAGSRANYPSKVTELIGTGVTDFGRRGDQLVAETLRRLADEGTDTLEVVAAACHEAGIACFASLRMNGDYADNYMQGAIGRLANSDFWRAHPELRCQGEGGQSRLSFAHREVREFKLGILREVAARDIDGINLDFLRHPPFFGTELPAESRAAVMTGFVRDVRRLLDDEGRKKGRHLGLSARVEWNEYLNRGCDIETWLKEGLLDYLVLTQHTLGGFEFDLAPFVQMAKGSGCAVLFGEEATLSGHDRTPQEDKLIAEGKMKAPKREKLTLEQYQTRAARWYAAGADGVHLFNETDRKVMSVLGSVKPTVTPTAPADVRTTDVSPAHLRVEWNDVANDETGYRIWRRRLTPDGPRPWHLAGEVPANATHFDDGGLNHETEYEHKVAAFGPAGESEAITVSKASRTPRMTSHLESQIIVPAGKSAAAVAPAALAEPDGRVLLAYSQNGLVLRRSTDQGLTWSEPERPIQNPPKGYYTKVGLARLQDDSIGLAFTHLTPIEGSKLLDRQRLFIRSRDGSEPWSEPVFMGKSSANNATLILGAEGRLLDALNDGFYPNVLIVASDDSGTTWRTLSEVAAKPNALPTGESSLVHNGGGNLVLLSRHERPFYCLNFSADNGATWDGPHTLWLGGGDNPPKIAAIPGTKLLVAVVSSWFDGAKAKDRRQLASVISADGGRTWDNFRLIGFSPEGDDGFVQYSLSFGGDTAYLFYGGGTKGDTARVTELRLLRLHRDFFTSRAPWPYDWQGKAKR